MSILSSRCSVLTAALIGSTLALGSTLISKPAFAGTATNNLTVSASVVATCSVNTTSMAFGNYDKVNGSTAQSTVSLNCSSPNIPGTIALDGGGFGGSTITNNPSRALNNGGTGPTLSLIPYQIYKDAAGTAIWASGPTTTQPFTSDQQSTASFTAHSKIAANVQGTAVGNYTDTVIVTVTY